MGMSAAATQLARQADSERAKLQRHCRTEARKAFADKKDGMRRVFAAARPRRPPSLTYLLVEGKPIFAPFDIDEVYYAHWGPILSGADECPISRAGVFFETYGPHIHRGPQVMLPAL